MTLTQPWDSSGNLKGWRLPKEASWAFNCSLSWIKIPCQRFNYRALCGPYFSLLKLGLKWKFEAFKALGSVPAINQHRKIQVGRDRCFNCLPLKLQLHFSRPARNFSHFISGWEYCCAMPKNTWCNASSFMPGLRPFLMNVLQKKEDWCIWYGFMHLFCVCLVQKSSEQSPKRKEICDRKSL